MTSTEAAGRYELARKKRMEGDSQGYFALMREALELEPDNCDYLFEYAENLYYPAIDAGKEVESAILALTRVIESCKKEEFEVVRRAYTMRALLYEATRQLPPAIQDMDWVIAHGEKKDRYLDFDYRGELKFVLGMYQEAAEDFAQASMEKPYAERTRNLLAVSYYHAKLLPELVECATETIARFPTTSADRYFFESQSHQLALHLRGKAYLELGQPEMAMADFQAVMRLRCEPDDFASPYEYPHLGDDRLMILLKT